MLHVLQEHCYVYKIAWYRFFREIEVTDQKVIQVLNQKDEENLYYTYIV